MADFCRMDCALAVAGRSFVAPALFFSEDDPCEKFASVPSRILALLFLVLFQKHRRLLVRLLRKLPSLPRMFHRLFGLIVPGKMVAFAVTRRRSPMRVRRLLVKLSRSLMRIVRHFHSPLNASSTLTRSSRDVHQLISTDQKGYSADPLSDWAQRERRKQRLYSNLFFCSYIQQQQQEPVRA